VRGCPQIFPEHGFYLNSSFLWSILWDNNKNGHTFLQLKTRASNVIKLTEEAKNLNDFWTTEWQNFVSDYWPKFYPNNKEMNRYFWSIRLQSPEEWRKLLQNLKEINKKYLYIEEHKFETISRNNIGSIIAKISWSRRKKPEDKTG
jgi:hypothetical protein